MIGLQLIKLIIGEFSSSKDSLGLPAQFHLQCRIQFQQTCLLSFFQLIMTMLHDYQHADGLELDILLACLTTCDTILSWNHKGIEENEQRTVDAVYLPCEWSEIILMPQVLHLFFFVKDLTLVC